MINVAVILAGSGVKDGSEIHEATLTLYFLDQLGINVQCFAPNRNQHHVINHLNENEENENRNILNEAARIARGDILPITELNLDEFDAIVYPGGFGSAKNLCDYAIEGKNMTVFEDVAQIIKSAHLDKKVQGFICIAPVMAARIIPGVTVTIGEEGDTANDVRSFGAIHKECSVGDIVWDEKNNVLSTPAYMLGPSIKDIAIGIKKLCEEVNLKCKETKKSLAKNEII